MRIDLDDIERKAKAATPGPWKLVGTVEQDGGDCEDIIPTGVSCSTYCYGGSAERAKDVDLDFIAAANPATIIELVRRLRDAEAENKGLAQALDRQVVAADQIAGRLLKVEEELDELRNRPPAAWRVKLPAWPDFGAWNDAGEEGEYAYWAAEDGAEFQYAIVTEPQPPTPCQGHARQQEAEELAEWVEQKEKALHEKFIASLGGQEAKSGD